MGKPSNEAADGVPSSGDQAAPPPCRRGGAGITLVSFGDFNPRASRQLERA